MPSSFAGTHFGEIRRWNYFRQRLVPVIDSPLTGFSDYWGFLDNQDVPRVVVRWRSWRAKFLKDRTCYFALGIIETGSRHSIKWKKVDQTSCLIVRKPHITPACYHSLNQDDWFSMQTTSLSASMNHNKFICKWHPHITSKNMQHKNIINPIFT